MRVQKGLPAFCPALVKIGAPAFDALGILTNLNQDARRRIRQGVGMGYYPVCPLSGSCRITLTFRRVTYPLPLICRYGRRRWATRFCRRWQFWAPAMVEKFKAELHRVLAYLRWPAPLSAH